MGNKDTSKKQSGKSVGVQRLVSRYIVTGVCFVPTQVTMEVEACSEDEAVKAALEGDWRDCICLGDGERVSAFDWQPTARSANRGVTNTAG